MANIEENSARFLANQDSIRRLMKMDSNGQMNQLASNARTNGKLSMNEDGLPTVITSTSNTNTQFLTESQMQHQQMPQVAPSVGRRNSKLPMEIVESFKTTQIDTSVLGLGTQGSVLDRINFNTNGQLFKEQTPQQIVTEAKPEVKTVTEQAPVVTSSVDYSMIKMIVEECMRKYTSALKKTILTENKNTNENNTLKAMKIGDKFTFVTDNGDLYEAKLTFIKNINKKGEK